MKSKGDIVLRALGIALGLAAAASLVLSSRIPPGTGTLGADVILASAPTGELGVSPVRPVPVGDEPLARSDERRARGHAPGHEPDRRRPRRAGARPPVVRGHGRRAALAGRRRTARRCSTARSASSAPGRPPRSRSRPARPATSRSGPGSIRERREVVGQDRERRAGVPVDRRSGAAHEAVRRILGSILVVGAVGLVAGAGTFAAFSGTSGNNGNDVRGRHRGAGRQRRGIGDVERREPHPRRHGHDLHPADLHRARSTPTCGCTRCRPWTRSTST